MEKGSHPHFLKSRQSKVFQEKPKSILVISAHWETWDPTVNVIDGPNDTIHDFYGFLSQAHVSGTLPAAATAVPSFS
ncbi:hypothetical protein AAC387_Pa04g2170 [Persea americana]